MSDININDISMYGEHGVEMIDDNNISRRTTFSSEKITEMLGNVSDRLGVARFGSARFGAM